MNMSVICGNVIRCYPDDLAGSSYTKGHITTSKIPKIFKCVILFIMVSNKQSNEENPNI